MRKYIVVTLIIGFLVSMVSVVGAVESLNRVITCENIEKGLYRLDSISEKAFVEIYKDNGEVIPVYLGKGGRYIEITEEGMDIDIEIYSTGFKRVEEVEVKDNSNAKEGVYIGGKDLEVGIYTFTTNTEYCGIVQKLTTLEIKSATELGEVFFIEQGEVVEVEVNEGEIIQVIQAEGILN